MHEPTPTLAAEIEAIREAYAALNRGDVPGFVRMCDPQIERTEPADFPSGGSYSGLAAVTEHVSRGRATWAEGTCTPEQFFENGDKVVVYVHAWVRLHGATEWMGGRFADGFRFRDGKIVEYRTFGQRADALSWAGIAL